ncbi:lysozyme inhibitor LprI family protein [Kumtagia ephedrae]|uniref:Urease-associated protein n=1 Tax=Kumtagia ephedrae TaxID=2116701 RepID=A0A2P7SD98_9HYPH|nr:lysozyme inhibitor LprI family protein [Mesorhizobium ephedrae]PSJ60486.1 urease-associated protein [Mesorhizobium ephedrae]
MRLVFAALGAMLLTTAAAQADDCANAQDQATMDKCSAKAFAEADKKLNADFREIEKRLGDDAKAKHLLVHAQRAWIAFRDAECAFNASGVDGGSAYPMVYSECQAALTNQRVKDFRTYLSCEEGDMSCPVPAQ